MSESASNEQKECLLVDASILVDNRRTENLFRAAVDLETFFSTIRHVANIIKPQSISSLVSF